jgi:Fic family protein
MYEPRFSITNKILNQIAAIEALREKVAHSHILPERQTELRYRASIERIHDSTSIEGNPLTLKQVEEALSDRAMTRHEYAVLEVRNYKKALDHIERRKLSDKPLTRKDLLAIHHLAMKGLLPGSKAGSFRTDDIYIVDQDDHMKYKGPAAAQVEELTSWIEYFVDGFLSSAKVLSAEIAILSLLIPPSERLKLKPDETDILSYARQFGSLTINDACEILAGKSRRTVQRRLKKLVNSGLLAVSDEGRNTHYFWRE